MVLKAPLAHAQAPTHATLRARVRAAVDPIHHGHPPDATKEPGRQHINAGWFGRQARTLTNGGRC
jgi:hypothetical protein